MIIYLLQNPWQPLELIIFRFKTFFSAKTITTRKHYIYVFKEANFFFYNKASTRPPYTNFFLLFLVQGNWKTPFEEVNTMNFINLPVAFRGRRLIQVPSGVIKTNTKLNAGYDPELDATMAELPYKGGKFSLILILPGKQTEFIAGGLSRIESRLNSTLWNGMLRKMSPHKLDFKMPFFRHRSVINNLKDAFTALDMKSAFSPENADFSGVNGGRDLWMSEIVQLNEIKVDAGSGQPGKPQVIGYRSAGRYRNYRKARKMSLIRNRFKRQGNDESEHEHHEQHEHHHDQDHHESLEHNGHDHHSATPNTNADSNVVRIYFERQFMYAVRHNPTGMLIYIGRYYQPEEAVQDNHDTNHPPEKSHDNHHH